MSKRKNKRRKMVLKAFNQEDKPARAFLVLVRRLRRYDRHQEN